MHNEIIEIKLKLLVLVPPQDFQWPPVTDSGCLRGSGETNKGDQL